MPTTNTINYRAAQRLKILRLASKLSLQELAEQLEGWKVSASQLEVYEKGQVKMPIDFLVAVARFFELPLTTLIGLYED